MGRWDGREVFDPSLYNSSAAVLKCIVYSDRSGKNGAVVVVTKGDRTERLLATGSARDPALDELMRFGLMQGVAAESSQHWGMRCRCDST